MELHQSFLSQITDQSLEEVSDISCFATFAKAFLLDAFFSFENFVHYIAAFVFRIQFFSMHHHYCSALFAFLLIIYVINLSVSLFRFNYATLTVENTFIIISCQYLWCYLFLVLGTLWFLFSGCWLVLRCRAYVCVNTLKIYFFNFQIINLHNSFF